MDEGYLHHHIDDKGEEHSFEVTTDTAADADSALRHIREEKKEKRKITEKLDTARREINIYFNKVVKANRLFDQRKNAKLLKEWEKILNVSPDLETFQSKLTHFFWNSLVEYPKSTHASVWGMQTGMSCFARFFKYKKELTAIEEKEKELEAQADKMTAESLRKKAAEELKELITSNKERIDALIDQEQDAFEAIVAHIKEKLPDWALSVRNLFMEQVQGMLDQSVTFEGFSSRLNHLTHYESELYPLPNKRLDLDKRLPNWTTFFKVKKEIDDYEKEKGRLEKAAGQS